MSYSSSTLAYPDVIEALDRALASAKGIKVSLETKDFATRFIARANSYRALDRRENAKVYPEGNALHGRSHYDVLVLRQRENEVLIEIIKPEELRIEEL